MPVIKQNSRPEVGFSMTQSLAVLNTMSRQSCRYQQKTARQRIVQFTEDIEEEEEARMSCESDESGIRLGGNTTEGMLKVVSSERRSEEVHKEQLA